MERLLETISYEAADKSGEKYVIDAELVDKNLQSLAQDEDLSRYIL
jgi:ATP-dependent HslUV protease ATP-binding subunit HslU